MEPEQTPTDDESTGAFWVTSEFTHGKFRCVLLMNDERLRTLDRDTGAAYADELTYVAVCAEYDAAVVAQCTAAGMSKRLMGRVVTELRGKRRPFLEAALAPLQLTTIVAQRDLLPRVAGRLGELTWQWDMVDIRRHTRHVREVLAGGELDGIYYRYLVRTVGLPEDEAQAYVARLRDHRPDDTDG